MDRRCYRTVVLLLAVAAMPRLALALAFYGTVDVEGWEMTASLMPDGEAVYESGRYVYPPLWMWILYGFRLVAAALPMLPLHFWLKLPVVLADVGIVLLLVVGARALGRSWRDSHLAALAYAANPVSVLLTGYQGHFHPLQVALTLAAWVSLTRLRGLRRVLAVSASLSLALQAMFLPGLLLPLFMREFRRWWEKVTVAAFSVGFLSATILPYLLATPFAVVSALFLYYVAPPLSSVESVPWNFGQWGYSLGLEMVTRRTDTSVLACAREVVRAHGNQVALMVVALVYVARVPRLSALDGIILVYATVLVWSSRVIIDYMMWLLPFGLLARDRAVKYFTFFVTPWLLANYLGSANMLGTVDHARTGFGMPAFAALVVARLGALSALAGSLVVPVWWMGKLMGRDLFAPVDRALFWLIKGRSAPRAEDPERAAV